MRFVISHIDKDGQRKFVANGECGYPFLAKDYENAYFYSHKAAMDYIALLDEFRMWSYINITKEQVIIEQVIVSFAPMK